MSEEELPWWLVDPRTKEPYKNRSDYVLKPRRVRGLRIGMRVAIYSSGRRYTGSVVGFWWLSQRKGRTSEVTRKFVKVLIDDKPEYWPYVYGSRTSFRPWQLKQLIRPATIGSDT